ncbi:MAG: restriction endonuclease subunit S [bacterium]|nr:restriction endonuclease subunit S [bacterium]
MKTNWQTKKLGEVCNVIAGQSPEGRFYNKFGNGLAFYQGKKEFTEKFIGEPMVWTTKVTKEALAGDILMSVRAPVGPTNLATGKICIGRGLAAIRPSALIDKDFLYIFFKKHESEIIGNSGAVFNSISKTQIEDIEIPFPPLPEQQRIVKILDEVFDGIAKAKENTEKNLQNAKELFESYLQNIFANPGKDWEEKKVKEIGETQTGLTPKTANKNYYGDFVPFITPADVNIFGDGSVRYNNRGLSAEGLRVGRKIEKNSVLMVCIGATIGKVGFATEAVSCNQQINTLTPLDKYEAKLFYYLLSTKSFFNKIIKGSSQATLPIINKGKWENLLVTFPKSLSEQKAIVKKLDTLSAQTKKLEEIYKQKLTNLDELKKSVLKKAFAGEM